MINSRMGRCEAILGLTRTVLSGSRIEKGISACRRDDGRSGLGKRVAQNKLVMDGFSR